MFSCQTEEFAGNLIQLDDLEEITSKDGLVITRKSFDDFSGLETLYEETVTNKSKSGKKDSSAKNSYDFEKVTTALNKAFFQMDLHLGLDNQYF